MFSEPVCGWMARYARAALCARRCARATDVSRVYSGLRYMTVHGIDFRAEPRAGTVVEASPWQLRNLMAETYLRLA